MHRFEVYMNGDYRGGFNFPAPPVVGDHLFLNLAPPMHPEHWAAYEVIRRAMWGYPGDERSRALVEVREL